MNSEATKSFPDETVIRHLLRQVIDPEVGMNIVDLGLVYRVDAGASGVLVEMTMTSPACPLGEMITAEVKDVLTRALPPDSKTEVRLVWEPTWKQSMMSEAGKRHFGWTPE
jgi:metal-sulfur cluster biosynthetic enzyme